MKFCKLMKYDIVNGILKRAYLYLPVLFMTLCFLAGFYRKIFLYDAGFSDMTETVTIVNFLFCLFEGKDTFHPETEQAFVFPVVWLLIFLYAAFVTLNYPYRDLLEDGTQVMIRVKDRKSWWLSKCFWIFLSTIIYFVLLYFAVLAFCLLENIDISLHYASSVNEEILNMQLHSLHSEQIIGLVFILPVTTALAINFLQLCMGLFLDRIYCYSYFAY